MPGQRLNVNSVSYKENQFNMQTKQIFTSIAAATLLILSSCRKNFADEQYIPINNSVKPDLVAKINATVTGFVNDESNKPVAGAQVTAGSKTTTTDEYGYFKISNVSVGKTAGFIKIEKTGYFKAYRTFVATAAKETFVRVKMLDKVQAGVVSAATGGTATTAEGAKVILPANGIVTASGSAPYTGTVYVYARAINTASANDLQLTMPGDGRAVDTAGYLRLLNSYSAIAVELAGSAGEKLQIAPAAKATLQLPIPAALSAAAPATIALWSFNETNGLWQQESVATKTGNEYTGTVQHFSFWDGALGIPLVNLKVQVVNSLLQPLANVPVVITYSGQPLNSGYGRFAFTDINGNAIGAVPANANLVLQVQTTCAITAYSQNFTTGNNDIDLGTVSGNMGQGMVTISGTATNCAGQPVTDGYIQTYDGGFYNRIPIVSGNFSFTGLACVNTVANYVVIDNTTHQQNNPQSITLVPGVNNLGNLSACGTSSIGMISYTIDGVTRTYTEPTDTLGGYYFSPFTTLVKLSGIPGGSGSPSLTLQFDGGNSIGSGHKITDIWSEGYASGRAYAPVPLTVTITEYGNAGGFISGSFSGMVLDFTTNAIHNVSYNFRFKRYN